MHPIFRKPQRKLGGSFNLHTYLTETSLGAGFLIHAAGWVTVTGHTRRVTLITKLAAITFFSRVTFLARTLTRPLPCEEKWQNDPTGR